MSETVLVLPVLTVILAFLLYFGDVLVQTQQLRVTDRYEAWREEGGAAGPSAIGANGPNAMNQMFFNDRLNSVTFENDDGFPADVQNQLISDVASFPSNFSVPGNTASLANQLASDMILGDNDVPAADQGRHVSASAVRTDSRAIVAAFQGPLVHQHTRMGNDWAYANGWVPNAAGPNGWMASTNPGGPDVLTPVKDVFFQNFDNQLTTLNNLYVNNLISTIRSIMYTSNPGYVGPYF